MCITLRIASIVSILATIFAAFCLALCGIGVILWRFANTADEEYNRGTK